jgi:hypothetical protein
MVRFTMYPDGVSYLDIGDAYWRGDWHNAINAYWSPLYPCIIGFFIKTFKPTSQSEYPLVHLVNFLMYVGTMFCFDFFLRNFVAQQTTHPHHRRPQAETGLPNWVWYVVGYCCFVVASLFLITISFVSGDMIVAAMIYVAAGLMLKIHRSKSQRRLFALLGLVLGLGYLAKTVMFLMAFPFIAVCVATQEGRSAKSRAATISLGAFLAVAAPFVFVLSVAKGRLTFGESGKINYVMNVGTTQFFTPHEKDAKHPVRQLAALPDAYEYSHPVAGTYPLWYDPAYWHEGIKPHFDLWRQIRTILLAIAECAWISFNVRMGISISVVICFLYLVGESIRGSIALAGQSWIIWLPALAGIGLYSLVVIEPRYVAALFCLLWMVAFSGVRLLDSRSSRRLIAGAALTLAFLTLSTAVSQVVEAHRGVVFTRKDIATPIIPKVADALIANGIRPMDKIAIISDWLFPSRQGAYIARLARIQIIGEARQDKFWAADDSTRAQVAAEFSKAGARALLSYKPLRVDANWQRLAGTDYYLYWTGLLQDGRRD